MRLPGCQIKISSEATDNANPVSFPLVRKGPAEFVLPAAQQSLHHTLRGMVQGSSSRGKILIALRVHCCDVLHLELSFFLRGYDRLHQRGEDH